MTDNNSTSIDNIPESTPVYAILHFDLCQPEGERRLRECLDAPNVLRAVEDFEREIHEILKYSKTPEVWGEINGYAALDRVRDMLFECFAENNVRAPRMGVIMSDNNSAYCATEGSGVSTLEHLRKLEAESESDRLQRETVDALRALREELDSGNLEQWRAIEKAKRVLDELVDAMGW